MKASRGVVAMLGVLAAFAPGRSARAQGAVAFAPTIGTVPDGVTLRVRPLVTADRRYVRLTELNPTFLDFDRFDTFSIPVAVSGGGFGGGMGAGGFASIGLGGSGALSGIADPRPPSSFMAAEPRSATRPAKATRGRRRPTATRPASLVRTSTRAATTKRQ